MEYAATGGDVDPACRIQGQKRDAYTAFVTRVLLDRVGPIMLTESLGEILVKGKNNPIELYVLKSLRSASDS